MKSMAMVGVVACGLIASTQLASAQIRPEAEKLFRDGKELMKAGKIADACSAFEASERAEHAIATLLSLADCREKNFQLASAWALFLQAESQTRGVAKQSTLNATAKARAATLEPRLSYLTINVSDDSRVAGLVVTRDGVVIDTGEWNRALPIDGGTHEIAGKAPGHESWATKSTLKPERDKQSVEVPKFKELPKLAVPPTEHAITQITQVAPVEPSIFTMRRKLAIGVAGGGVVVAGVGAVLAITASNLRNEALATCPPSSCSEADAQEAQSINDRARRRAILANVGFAVGGAAIVAGAVLWLTGAPAAIGTESPDESSAARRRKQRRPQVTIVPQLDGLGLAALGRF